MQPELNVPGESKVTELFEQIKGTRLEIPVLLAAIVPARRSEICGLSLDDLTGDILRIHRAVVYDKNQNLILKEYPKTDKSNREVLLPSYVADLIRAKGVICDYTPGALSRAFTYLLQKNGMDHCRLHDLRHAFVSIAHAQKMPDAYIQERGGWSTDYVMKHVYRHTFDDVRIREQSKVNDTFTALIPDAKKSPQTTNDLGGREEKLRGRKD